MKSAWRICLLVMSIILLTGLGITGCAKNEVASPGAQGTFKWPSETSFIVSPVGSSSTTQTTAIAPIIEQKTGMKVRVTPEGVTPQRFVRTMAGEFDFSLVDVGSYNGMLLGDQGLYIFDVSPMRVVRLSDLMIWALITRGDNNLKSIYDIKKMGGRSIAVNVSTPIFVSQAKGLMAFLGTTDLKIVPFSGGYKNSVAGLVDGKADVTFTTTTGAPTYEAAAGPRGIRWLDMPMDDKEGWAEFIKYNPDLMPGTVVRGIEASIGISGPATSALWMCTDKIDQEYIYQMSKWFDDNYDLYKDTHPCQPTMRVSEQKVFLDRCPIPVAEGAIRYFKEAKIWTANNDKWNNEAIKLETKYIEARHAFLAEAKSKKLTLPSDEAAALWQKYIKDLPPIKMR